MAIHDVAGEGRVMYEIGYSIWISG